MTYTRIGSRRKLSLRHELKDEKTNPARLCVGGASGGATGWHCGNEGRGQPHTHRLGGFDEHFAPPELELVNVHVDRLQQVEDTLFLVSSP